jgi:hypothetical protein
MTDLIAILAQILPESIIGSQNMATPVVDQVFAFYAANLRVSFFTGFFTLGSFLVAVNTFIIVNLKKELYDHDSYRSIALARRQLNKVNGSKSNVTYFGPLKRLSTFLFWAILSSLLTAVSQVTIGLVPYRLAAIFCITLAGFTIILLLIVMFTIKKNLQSWFDFLEQEAVAKEAAGKKTENTQAKQPGP